MTNAVYIIASEGQTAAEYAAFFLGLKYGLTVGLTWLTYMIVKKVWRQTYWGYTDHE